MNLTRSKSSNRGFSLVELSVALVVIGVILSIVLSTRSLLTDATSQSVYVKFVQRWVDVYTAYKSTTGRVPSNAANFNTPNGEVNGGLDKPLCGADLIQAVVAAGVPLPSDSSGRGPDTQVVTDAAGNIGLLKICFVSTRRAMPTPTGLAPVSSVALLIRDIDNEMAGQFDVWADGIQSPRLGRLRTAQLAAQIQPPPPDETWLNADVSKGILYFLSD